MKALSLLLGLFFSTTVFAQTPHGKVYGLKPNSAGVQDATKLEAFMSRKVSISTTIKGKVLEVTNPKGGWFTIDAGNGKVITAHFKTAGINIPASLKGKTVVAEGVATKQFIADDSQHFAGDTATGKKQHKVNADANHKLAFAVRGLMVE